MAVPVATVVVHEQRSALGRLRRNKFREVARTTENPTTKLLAEGLTHLSEAIRELPPGAWAPREIEDAIDSVFTDTTARVGESPSASGVDLVTAMCIRSRGGSPRSNQWPNLRQARILRNMRSGVTMRRVFISSSAHENERTSGSWLSTSTPWAMTCGATPRALARFGGGRCCR